MNPLPRALGRAFAVAGWCAALAAAYAVLRATGTGALAPPSGELRTWLTGREPAVAAMALTRLGAVAGWWYLAGVTALGMLSRLSGLPALVRATDWCTVAPVRRVLHASLGAGVVVASLAGPAGAEPGPAPSRDVPVMRRLDDGAPAPAAPPVSIAPPVSAAPSMSDAPPAEVTATEPEAPPEPAPEPAPEPPPQAEPEPAPEPAVPGAPSPAPPPASTPAEPLTAPTQQPPPPDQPPPPGPRIVQPGESFWRIAQSTLAAAYQRPPTPGEVAPYWRALIAANRPRLANPGNPDLLFAGQQLDLPHVAAPTGHGIP